MYEVLVVTCAYIEFEAYLRKKKVSTLWTMVVGRTVT